MKNYSIIKSLSNVPIIFAIAGLCLSAQAQITENLLRAGEEKYAISDLWGALILWEKGLTLAEEDEDALAIEVFCFRIGAVHHRLESYRKALEYYSRALKIARRFYDRGGGGEILVKMGMAQEGLGDYSRAFHFYRRALRAFKKSRDRKGAEMIVSELGRVCEYLGDYPGALEYFGKVLKIKRDNGDRKGEALSLSNLGVVYEYLGDYAGALDFFRQALKISGEIGDRFGEGAGLSNLGSLYGSLGDYEKAVDYYGRSLNLKRRTGDRRGEGSVLFRLGAICEYLGDYSKSLDYYRRALKVNKEIGAPAGAIERKIGGVYLAQGRRKSAFKKFQRLKDDLGLGVCYLLAGRPGKAGENFTRAVAHGEKARETETLVSGYLGLALSEERLNRRASARLAYEKAVAALERHREMVTHAARIRFFSGKVLGFPRIEAYEGRVRISARPEKAFYWSEKLKAQVFAESFSGGSEEGAAGVSLKLAKYESELTARIPCIHRQMGIALEKKNRKRYRELESELERAKKELADHIASLRRKHPEYAAVRYPQPVEAGEVFLKPGEVLLEYEVTEPKTLLFVLGPGKTVTSFEIPVSRKRLGSLVRTYRRLSKGGKPVEKGGFALKTGMRLYNLLLKGAFEAKDPATGLPLVSRESRVIIVPDEVLELLPFKSLISRFAAPSDITYAESITYAKSATALTAARKK